MESRKNGIDALIGKAEIQTQQWRTNAWTPRGKREGVGRIEIDMYVLIDN